MTYEKFSDEFWMNLALAEARKGRGRTSPNPMVGAVLVRGNRLLAKGHHRRAGLPHAEIEAIKKIKNPKGSTLYVTLEPCCHTEKRTPPCVDAIVKTGIRRVVVGCRDPNPKVSGKGLRKLKKAKIRSKVGVLEKDCQDLNRYYNHWIRRKRPWVILKMAQSLDGRVALGNGKPLWITGPKSRRRVHELRSEVDGILAGIGTIKADNPRLDARLGKNSPQPIRIVLDPHLKISERARVLTSNPSSPCWVITSPKKINSAKAGRLSKRGVKVFSCPSFSRRKFQLKKLLEILGKRGLMSLMVEGGPGTWTHFLKQSCAQEILLFVAPKFLGAQARSLLGPLEKRSRLRISSLDLTGCERLGSDTLLRFQLG